MEGNGLTERFFVLKTGRARAVNGEVTMEEKKSPEENPTCPKCGRVSKGPHLGYRVDGKEGVKLFSCETCVLQCHWDDDCHPRLMFYVSGNAKVVTSCGPDEHA